ncbi:hypothetical protein LTR94_026086, partial [Friedmanniomyces endolithicus]
SGSSGVQRLDAHCAGMGAQWSVSDRRHSDGGLLLTAQEFALIVSRLGEGHRSAVDITNHMWQVRRNILSYMDSWVSSPKSKLALERLGRDIRNARLRRGMPVTDLAVRAGASPSTLARLEKGDAGVGLGTLADVLVALGLVERLADLVDIRSDELGLALAQDSLPKRGRSARPRSASTKQSTGSTKPRNRKNVVDPDGAAF